MANVVNAELGVQRTSAHGRWPIRHIKTIALVALLCLASLGVWDMSSANLTQAPHAEWRQLHEAPEVHHDGNQPPGPAHETGHGTKHEGEGNHAGGHKEGGHEEGGHEEGGHGHHEGGHHKKGTGKYRHVDTTSAIMLFGLFLFNNLVLYFVNYRDEHIRDNSYKMINTTISIFTAVMMNSAVFSFICEQIIPSPFPRGFNVEQVRHGDPKEDPELIHAMYAVVGVCVVLFNFMVINAVCLYFKDNHHALFGIESITGHLCAFSAIYCFGNLMELHWFSQTPLRAFLVILIEISVCIPILCLSRWWRVVQQRKNPDEHHEGEQQEKEGEIEKDMEKACREQDYDSAQRCKDKMERLKRKRDFEEKHQGKNIQRIKADMDSAAKILKKTKKYEEAQFFKDIHRRLAIQEHNKENKERLEKNEPIPKDHWMHAAEEAEDEAVTLVSSFLISQVVGFKVIGHLPAMHHAHMTQADLHQGTNISWCAIGASVLLVLGTILLRTQWDKPEEAKRDRIEAARKKGEKPEEKNTPLWLLRLVPGIHRLVGMCVSWFLYRSLEWHMLLWVPAEMGVAHSLAAFVALVASICGIWILDYFGDKLRDSQNKKDEGKEKQEEDSQNKKDEGKEKQEEDESLSGRAHTPSARIAEAENLLGDVVEGADVLVDKSLHVLGEGVGHFLGDKEKSHAHVEDAFRNLIKSIAIFVGLSWEKAFDVAELTVVEHLDGLKVHVVLSKVFLALLVCSFMLPGWYWYIMPKALMNHDNHSERIKLEEDQEKRNKGPRQ